MSLNEGDRRMHSAPSRLFARGQLHGADMPFYSVACYGLRKGANHMQQKAIHIGTLTSERQDSNWRLRSVGYNLAAAAVIGIIAIVGTVFEVLQTLKNPGRWQDVVKRDRSAQLALHEWHVDDAEDP